MLNKLRVLGRRVGCRRGGLENRMVFTLRASSNKKLGNPDSRSEPFPSKEGHASKSLS